MQNVILIVHLVLAICLIAAVLLQRSEGGALGIGGGGGGGMTSMRSQATALTKLTWGIAVAFLATSITLAILAGNDPTGGSVLDAVERQNEAEQLLEGLPPPAELGPGDIVLPGETRGGGSGGASVGGAAGEGTAGGGASGSGESQGQGTAAPAPPPAD